MARDIWIISEQKGNRLRAISFELLTWGRTLANKKCADLCAVVLGDDIPSSELEKLIQHGADKVYWIQNRIFRHFLVDPEVQSLLYLVKTYQPEILLGGATTMGRTIMPYLAILLHTGLTADCVGLELEEETGNLLQIRPAIGGNIMATILTPKTRPQMATMRPNSINQVEANPNRRGVIIKPILPEEAFTSRIRFEKFISCDNGKIPLEGANIVVSGGRGLINTKAFHLVEKLANALGAAVGSSRPPVDQGLQPYIRQIGLSGRTINPGLYIACGISGSIQHMAGILTAKNIIAINSDPKAPIFLIADLGIVGDVREVLPVLTKYVEAYCISLSTIN